MATANLLTKMICLLVSPLAEDRLLVEEALGRAFADFLVLRVADAAGWQEALATGDFGLGIIADTLPWAETAVVVRGLKTLRPECPLIMLASPEREEAALEALLSGIDDYVLKSPEEMQRLPRVILAARYRARRLAGEPFLTGAEDFLARKEAEEKLRQSEIHYRSIFETTGTATCIDDENTILCLVNEEFAELAGYSREELEGKKSWTEFIVPEDLERLKKYHHMRRTDPGAAPKSYSFRWRDRQGRVKDILATITLIPGTAKSVASLLDITARQQAEQALRESEIRYRLLVETMNDGVGMQDDNGRITFVNRRACEIMGYPKEEILGRHLSDFLDRANQEIFREQVERRKDGERQTYELTWTRKDGTPITTNVSPVPMFDAAGKFKGSFAVITDLTARLQGEKALRKSEETYRTIFENTGTATAIAEEDTTISLANSEYLKLSGYSRGELEGKKSWTEFYRGDDLAKMLEYHRLRRLDPQQVPRNYEAQFITRQGEVKDILMTVGMIPGTKKSVASLLDITERKKTERELDLERNKFQVLTENSPFALVMIDQDGKFKYVNPRFSELFGYDLADVPDGRTWFRKAYPDRVYRHEIIAAWKEDLRRTGTGEKRPRTYTVTCKDGSEKIVSFVPVRLNNGDNLMTFEDITLRHRAAETVKRSEQHFRMLMENSMCHLGIIDAHGGIRYEGPTLERMLGYDFGELIGRNSFELTHPEDLAKSAETLKQLLESPGKVFSTEVRYRHKDGSWRFLEVKAKNMLDEPIIQGIVVNTQDVTIRREALEALRQSEDRYRAMVEDQTEFVTRYLPGGIVTFVNETFCRYTGKSREELIGKSFFPLLPEEDRVPVQLSIAALNQENPFATIEHRVLLPDGKVVWHQWTNRAIFDSRGKIVEFQGVGRDVTERKRAEEALRESEELHSRILDTVPDLVYELSLEGKIIYANSAAREILGYSPGALRQMNLADLLDEKGLAYALEVIREMVDSRKPSRTEYYRLRSAGGDFVPIETHAILMERSNQPPTIIGTARDISERQRAEEALRQAEAEKSMVLENMSEMVAYRDRDNRILWVNRAGADFYAQSPEQIVGRFCHEVYHRRQTPCPDCRLFEAVAAGRPMQTEVIKSDGRIVSVRSSPVRNEKGQVQGSVVVANDITDRKRAEKAIKDSEEKMRLVIESAPVGIRIIQHGRHIYVNPALVRMFGYRDAGEIIGWPVALGPLFAPDASVISPEKMAASPQGKEASSSCEGLGLKEDGAWMEVQVWQTEIDYQGAPATLDFILDISEAKALRSQLLHAQKMEAIGTLAGGIAHDFNNILLPILINAEMVQEDLPLDSPLRQKMGRVIKACQRAIDLVKQILAFSRHEERGLSPVSLAATIEDSLRLLRSTLPATIEIRQHLEYEGDTVLADPTQIQQVLINLCTNAAHAIGDRGGVIDISLQEVDAETARFSMPQNPEPGRWLHLMVKDNGPGMDPAIRERIFDPYFTTKKPGEGTGLGLAVVHGIVKKHGGVISVDSEPGKGSVFHIFLPRAEAEAIPEDASMMPLPKGRERILLVDNDPEIVATLQQLMEQLGYQVTTQTDSIEALRCFRTRPDDFDLVITDQTMPKLTGEDLAREILDLRPEIPVILCTGFSEAVSREKARVMGIREFLIKPIANRVIAETIRRALKPMQDLG